MGSTLREISLAKAKKQPKQIDYITANCPLLETISYTPSTHGLKHAYEVVTGVTGGGIVPIDGILPSADVQAQLKWADLGILGFNIEAGVDKVNQITNGGTFADYLALKTPKIIRKTSMETEKSVIYDLLLNFAQRNSKLKNAGASSGSLYSLFAVRWSDEEFCGLYDPNGFGQGAMLDTIPLSGGNPYKNSAGQTVYGADFKSYLGFLLENPQCISAIVNINSSNKPTADMVDDMLADAHAGDDGNTFVFGHPKALNMLKSLKGSALSMGPADTNYSRSMLTWNGIPMIGSYNFKDGTESAINFS